MTIEIRVPQLPESVSDASIAAWVVKEGDSVNEEDNLLELETDKVVLEVPAPKSGVLTKIIAEQGATVLAGDLIGLLEEGDVVEASKSKDEEASGTESTEANASPSIRKMMASHNLNESQIVGTGKNGRILKEDVDKALQAASAKTIETKKAL